MVARVHSKPSAAAPPAEVYDAETFQPRSAVGGMLGRVHDVATSALDRGFAADPELAPWELSWPQLKIIASLALGDEAKSASDLCKSISYDAGAMTRMIDRLESKGLIRRERCTSDRRLVYLELTDDGKRIWPKMREVTRKNLNALLRGFSHEEVRQLERFLHRMLENG
jgi:DNA-binding MarR family transcriptional regulator